MTLSFFGNRPPENVTIEGAHSFYNGRYAGSVSAASSAFESVRGRTVAGVAGNTGKVTINKREWSHRDSNTGPLACE